MYLIRLNDLTNQPSLVMGVSNIYDHATCLARTASARFPGVIPSGLGADIGCTFLDLACVTIIYFPSKPENETPVSVEN